MYRFVIALLLIPLMAHAEINFISLKHRTAESLIPVLQPVLDEGIHVSGKNFTLIVNAKPKQVEALRPLVAKFDTPLQSLMISVSQSGNEVHSIVHGDVSGDSAQPQLRVYGGHKEEQEAVAQQLRVIEGQWGRIRAGESLPVVSETTTRSYLATTTQRSVAYQAVESGFEVRPFLNGDTVTLEVRPFHATRAPQRGGTIDHQAIATTVRGRLGEWITIAVGSMQQQQQSSGTIYTTDQSGDSNHKVILKVERLSR